MRRILSMVVMLVMLMSVTSAFAETKEFFYSGYFLTYFTTDMSIQDEGVGNFTGGEELGYTFAAQRIRPYFSYKTANVEATVKFEQDWVLGGNSGAARNADFLFGFGNGKHGNIGPGSDKPSQLELKSAFIKVTVPELAGLWFKGGIDVFGPAGFTATTYYLEETGHLQVGYAFGNKNALGQSSVFFSWAPIESGRVFSIKGDENTRSDILALEASITMDTDSAVFKIAPSLWVVRGAEEQVFVTATNNDGYSTPYQDGMGIIPSLGFVGIFNGQITVIANATVATGKNEVAGSEMDYFGYMFSVDASYTLKLGQKVGFYFRAHSGDDPDTTDKNESFQANQLGGAIGGQVTALGGRFWFFETGVFSKLVGGNNLVYNPADVVRGNPNGAYIIGLYADMSKVIGKLGVYGALGYGMLATDAVVGAEESKDLGIEVDLSVYYEVEKARIFVEAAYLKAGKGYENKGTNGYFNVATLTKVRDAVHFAIGMDVTF